MRYGKRLLCLLLAALLAAGTLAGCGGTEEDEPQGAALRACVCAPVASLDPAMNEDPAAETVFHALYENLLREEVDEEGARTVVPAVAKEYELAENFDGTVDYVFTLRFSARWSDGARVKAKDFVYAWRRLVDPATASPHASILSMVSGYADARETGDTTRLAVRADGDSKLRVTLGAPCAHFLSDVCTAVATMPLRSDAVSGNADWASSSALPCDGAFRVGVWAKQELLYLQRNDHYYDSRTTTVGALRFIFADTAEEAERLYADGLADYVSPVRAAAEDAARLPLRSVTCLLYNHMSDAFSNASVRRAFDLVLDRTAMAEAAGGGQTAATGLVPHGVVNADADGEDFRTAGGALLAVDAEGYADRCAEGLRKLHLSGYSQQSELTCIYARDEGEAETAAAMLLRTWQDKLRLTVRAEGLPREAFDERVAAGEYDLAIDVFDVPWGDAFAYLAPYAGLDAANALHYASRPYDLLLGVAEDSRDSAARAAILHDAEALLLEDTALSPLWFGGECCLLREGFSGVTHDTHGNAYFSAATTM